MRSERWSEKPKDKGSTPFLSTIILCHPQAANCGEDVAASKRCATTIRRAPDFPPVEGRREGKLGLIPYTRTQGHVEW